MAKVHYLMQGLNPANNHEDLFINYLEPLYQYDSVTIYSAFTTSKAVLALRDKLSYYGNKLTLANGQ